MSFVKPSTSTKWVSSGFNGAAISAAPVLNGVAGSYLALLDAVLQNGYGLKAVDTAVVTNGICRLTFSSGVSAAQLHQVIAVGGITGAGVPLNGEQRVSARASGYVEFACDLPDGSLTGAITFKIAPMGWEKVFSKTNVSVYRSRDAGSAKPFLRVDDSSALFARVQEFEEMSDVDTGIGAAPLSPAGGFYWHKRQSAGGDGVYWVIAGDARGVMVAAAPNALSSAASANGYGLCAHYFGDPKSYRSGDAWSGVLCGAPTATYSDNAGCLFSATTSTGMVLQRVSAGLGGAVACERKVLGSGVSGADGTLGAFPARASNGLHVSEIQISDGPMASNGPRGVFPGQFHCPQSGVRAVMGVDARVDAGTGDFAGKKLLMFGVGALAGAATGCAVVDVTGPWVRE